MWRVIKEEKRPYTGEVKNVRKDGTEYWQELHITPVLGEEGVIRFFIGVEPDITDRKLRERFREDFASIIAHRVLSPATGVRWTLELLLGNERIPEEEKQKLESMYGQNLRTIDLLRDIIFLSRMNRGYPGSEDFDAITVIRNAFLAMENAYPDVTFSLEDGGASVPLHTSFPPFHHIVWAFLDNAARYNKKGGTVSAAARIDGKSFMFSVTDTGIGIPVPEQRLVFHDIFRASNVTPSHGIGSGGSLYIANMVSEQFGWQIDFSSEEGKGSTFSLSVPRVS